MAIKTPDKKNNNSSNNKDENQEQAKSKTISIDLENIEEPESVQMEFTDDEETANAHAKTQTKISKDDSDLIDPNTPIDKVQRDVAEYEQSKSGTLQYKDLKQMATFIITLIDTALSTAFRLFARDTSSSAYAMPAENKKLLIEQLALILGKYQSKFKIEFVFFSSLLVLYAPAAISAFNNRKKVGNALKAAKQNKPKDPGTPYYSRQVAEEIEKSKNESLEEKPEEKIVEQIKLPKRKRGTQPKAY